MSLIIRIVGALWALAGVVTCYGSSNASSDAAATTGAISIVAALLFVLPGLGMYALGSIMQRKRDATPTDK